MNNKSTIPIIHKEFINQVIENLKNDSRYDTLLGAGSMITNEMDEFSDIDLTLIVKDESFTEIMSSRIEFAKQFNGYLNSFTGEHVGEPRLLICLYQRPKTQDHTNNDQYLLHVDLKFIKFESLSELIEKPIVLWSRNNNELVLQDYITNKNVLWPNKPSQWFEDRIWIWIHNGLTKCKRGELLESCSMLSYIRDQVLGPLIHRRLNQNQRALRKLEFSTNQQSKQLLLKLHLTIPQLPNDINWVLNSFENSTSLYMELRNDDPPNDETKNMPNLILTYIKQQHK